MSPLGTYGVLVETRFDPPWKKNGSRIRKGQGGLKLEGHKI